VIADDIGEVEDHFAVSGDGILHETTLISVGGGVVTCHAEDPNTSVMTLHIHETRKENYPGHLSTRNSFVLCSHINRSDKT
jgi:hypothetical protein